jgi:hypothetical protein
MFVHEGLEEMVSERSLQPLASADRNKVIPAKPAYLARNAHGNLREATRPQDADDGATFLWTRTECGTM